MRMQQITIIVLRALRLCQLDLDLPLYSKVLHPKYWHSLRSSILSSYTVMSRLVANTKNSMNQNSLSGFQLVLLKMNSSMGVTILEKRVFWSMLISSFVFFLLISLRKKTMVSRKCMKMMKAWMLWLSMMILIRSSEMLSTQRYMINLMHFVNGIRCSGSSNQRYLQVSSSFSNSRKTMQQMMIRSWYCPPELMIDPKRQAQQAISTHSKISM